MIGDETGGVERKRETKIRITGQRLIAYLCGHIFFTRFLQKVSINISFCTAMQKLDYLTNLCYTNGTGGVKT